MKKRLLRIAVMLAVASAPLCCNAQPSVARQSAAHGQQPVFSVDAPAERLPNLDILKGELKQYHDCTCTCGCYTHDLDRQADRAIAFLRRRAAHANSQEKLAMVLDIDETSLSNYQELQSAGFAFDKSVFDAWIDTAQAPAIAGTLRLYKEAQRLGVSVFFITGRPEPQRDVTERNLRAQGFENWQQLILRPASRAKESVTAYKSGARAQIAAQGFKIATSGAT